LQSAQQAVALGRVAILDHNGTILDRICAR
jgi:hypothetical protein